MITCDYLLLTALDDEAVALAWALQEVKAEGPRRERMTGAPTVFVWSLRHDRGQLTVATASLLDMGNEAAGDYTRELLDVVRPTYIGFVGIAGAAADGVQPGRILLADRVWHYEPAKLKARKVEFRGATHISGRLLLDRLKHMDRVLLATMFPSLLPWEPPVVGTIASGEKVVAEAESRDRLRQAGRNVIGFEMEGHQFAAVVERALGSDRWFMIRSVQDAADHSKTDEHRFLACRKAAAYTVAFLLDSDLCIPASGDLATSPALSSSAPLEQPLERFATAIAKGLANASPAMLLEAFSESRPPRQIRWAAIEAEAAWRANLPVRCREAAETFLAEIVGSSEPLNDEEATLLRLAAWAEWKSGTPSRAKTILEESLHRVVGLVERGRWADLLGSIRRYDPADDFMAAIATYQQALSLKRSANDMLGVAISLQNIGFTYIEWLDLQHARYYFDALANHATTVAYEGGEISKCQAHLALAWIEIMHGRIADLGAARRHLQLAGEAIAGSYSHRSHHLLRASKALYFALRESSGYRSGLPVRPDRSFWARLVLAQVRAGRGEAVPELVRSVAESPADALLAPHRIEPLLLLAAHGYVQVDIGQRPHDWAPDPSLEWPLSEWLGVGPLDGLKAIRVLEAIAHFYAEILVAVSGDKQAAIAPTLGSSVRFVSRWARNNRNHALHDEVSLVGAILEGAVSARNALVHSTPSEAVANAERRVVAAVRRLASASTYLRSVSWVSRRPPLLRVAGIDIPMSHAFSSDAEGRLTFRHGTAVIAVEANSKDTE